MTTRKREDEELACAAGLEVKKPPALSGGTLTQTMRTRQFLLPVRAYVLASTHAMRHVTVGCDANRYSRNEYGLINPRFSASWQALRDGLRAPAAGDAGYSLSDYVQISDFVTKVLIRKRLCRWAPKRELTNLET